MNVLSIGTDRTIFTEGSAARTRMVEYGRLFTELHIVVFAKSGLGLKVEQIAPNVWVYPTQSRSRLFYVSNAYKVAKKVGTQKTGEWVVSTQDPFETGFVGMGLSRVLRAPLQIQIHTDFLSPYFRSSSFLNRIRVFMARLTLPHADRIRVVSERIKQSLEKAGYKLKTKPVVLPIVVDVEKIQTAQPLIDLHKKYPQFSKIVLMASRLEKEKNIPMAIEAFKTALKEIPGAGLVIVGKGGEEKRLRDYALREGLEKNVVFEGWQQDLVSYYKTADVFFSASLYEGYGLTLVEAALSGCPTVASDVGVVGYELPYAACASYPVGDWEAAASQLGRVLREDEFRSHLGDEALNAMKKHVVSHDVYLARYKESLEGERRE